MVRLQGTRKAWGMGHGAQGMGHGAWGMEGLLDLSYILII